MNSIVKKNKVAIRCMTYNHEKYIEDALKGFVKQITNFPFVAIVVDDASTDNEQKILWNFVNKELDLSHTQQEETSDYIMVVAPHKKNSNCTFVIFFLKYNHFSIKKDKNTYVKDWLEPTEFIALCEGDDYWTDPNKLQKQVDVLEKRQDITMVHTGFEYYFQDTQTFKKSLPVDTSLTNQEKIQNILDYNKYRVQTCTVLVRNNCWNKARVINKEVFNPNYFLMGDTQIWVGLLELGNIYYLSDLTSVYRISNNSACLRGSNSVKKIRFDLSCSEMRLYFIHKLKLDSKFKKEIEAVFYNLLLKYTIFNPEYIPYNHCDFKHNLILYFIRLPIIRDALEYYLTKKRGILNF